ncbi:MAG: hypothetical protein M3Y12_07230 [Bacteroidota bacterium]|nr:hypothetical protein [Bacteroidota bacterium]
MHPKPFDHLTDRQRLMRAGKMFAPPSPVIVGDKTRLARVGRLPGPVGQPHRFSRKTHFVVDVESHVRHNAAELVLYEQCIRETVAYKGEDGYANSPDQDLYIRQSSVTTWNPGAVFAPAIAPLFNFPRNLWDEFVDGTGPQNSAFLSEHPITSDLKTAMREEVERLTFLLYEKYNGAPGSGAKFVDMKLAFDPFRAIAALSNRNKTFVGSANMSGFLYGNRLVVVVADVKSAYSLALHRTHRLDHYRSRDDWGYGFTYQFYIWSVRLESYSWYMARRQVVDWNGFKRDWFGINPHFQFNPTSLRPKKKK